MVRLQRRDCETISNDISEGLPVTKAELLRVVKWERRLSASLQNKINGLRDAMVRLGLMLAADESRNLRHSECLLIISNAIKQPNADLSDRAGRGGRRVNRAKELLQRGRLTTQADRRDWSNY